MLLSGRSVTPFEIANALVGCIKAGKKVLVFGVGGNAATAIHFAAELSGKYEQYNMPLPCICLSENPSVITAISQDFGWPHVFERQIQALGQIGDIVVAFSISTKGEYLKLAREAAFSRGCLFVLVCGQFTNEFTIPDALLELSSFDTPEVQESQLKITHQVCGSVKASMEAKPVDKSEGCQEELPS